MSDLRVTCPKCKGTSDTSINDPFGEIKCARCDMIAATERDPEVTRLRVEVTLLREALRRYGDQSRMGTVEPMALQQAIDRALEGGNE